MPKKKFKRNMSTAWRCLSEPKVEEVSLLLMLKSDNAFIADQAAAFLNAGDDDREMKSIRNHLRQNLTRCFSEPGVLEMLDHTNVDFRNLLKETQTIFTAVPAGDLTGMYRLVRLILAMAFAEIEAAAVPYYGSQYAPIRIIVDETAQLKRFQPLIDTMATGRKWAIRCHLYTQTLSQLKALYGPDFNTIMGLVGCVQYWGGTNDEFTAKYISALAGVTTIKGLTDTMEHAPGKMGSHGENLTGRPIYFPDEVMRLPMPKQLIKITGRNVVEGVVIDPSLRDFPEYLKFVEAMKAGKSAKEAAHVCMGVSMPPPKRERTVKPARKWFSRSQTKPHEKSPLSPGAWFLAKLFGHDTR